MILDLRPAMLGAKGQRYAAALDGRVLCTSRQPLFDAARVLLSEGAPPDAVLAARHVGTPTIAMRSTVGEAAQWAIEERNRGGLRRLPWRPYSVAGGPADGPIEMADPPYAGVPENGRDDLGTACGPSKTQRREITPSTAGRKL